MAAVAFTAFPHMTGSRGADTIARLETNQGHVLNLQTDGVLLINLGSPASPSVRDVRRYLNEFLMDRHVLDVPAPIRRLIVSLFILPTRPKRSAHAYEQVWQKPDQYGYGSPLLQNGAALRDQLAPLVNAPVKLAMRYGEPSIASGIEALRQQGVQRLLVAPLYPQYADSTTTTAFEAARQVAGTMTLLELAPFYAEADYISALADVTRRSLPNEFDLLLMSFHGLPERHMTKADPTGSHCLRGDACCETPSAAHATCYRHQTRVTSSLLAQALGLPRDRWSISYQSRLGRLPWLAPYTDATLRELPGRGIKKLAVVCPAFVADNLETLEEIDITGRRTFMEAGGESLTLVPCLNADPAWVTTLATLCTRALNR
jgi:protoporphyrin/coproporphyrin ferrochelatase